MNEDGGIINTLIKGYNEAKLFFVEKFSDMNFFSIEAPFLDAAFITQNIEELEKLHNNLAKELKQYETSSNGSDYYTNKIHELKSQIGAVAVQLAFYLSLDSKNTDKAISLLNTVDDDFKICLNAIKLYDRGEYTEALETSFLYVKTIGMIPEHYLFNRNLAEMLMQNNDYKKAIPFLRKATEKKPDELSLHKMLLSCYRHEDMNTEADWQEQIIELLEAKI